MAARLTIVDGKGRGGALALGEKALHELGSGPLADLHVDDQDVARVHLKVHRDGDDFTVFDLSGRGFVLNGRRSLKGPLRDGDVIEVGATKLRFDTAPVLPPPPISGVSDIAPVWVDAPAVKPEPPAAKPLPRRWTLKAMRGNDAGKDFRLDDRDYFIIGRGVMTDITIWDIRASRVHCRIDREGEGFTISDLQSSNGTLVNGELVEKRALKSGDTVKIGSTVLRVAVE